MASYVVPLDAVSVSVVENSQAGLVVPLLETFKGQTHGIRDLLQLAGLDALEVVRLRSFQSGKIKK